MLWAFSGGHELVALLSACIVGHLKSPVMHISGCIVGLVGVGVWWTKIGCVVGVYWWACSWLRY